MTYNLKYINDNGEMVEFSLEKNIIISTATGFTENNINLSLSQGMNQIGSTVQGQSVQPKDMTFTGMIIGDTTIARRTLLRAIKPLIPARLIYNDEWEIRVYPTLTPIVEKSLTNARFQFVLKAAFPYWSKIEGSQTLLSLIEPLFTFPWDLSKEYFMFGGRKEGLLANVYNDGDVDAPYRVVFTALDVLSNPKITNAVSYEFLKLNREMAVGETITVDITPHGIYINSNIGGINTDIFGSLDIESNLYRMRPGDNIIQYDAEPNRSGLDVAVYYHALKAGVYD